MSALTADSATRKPSVPRQPGLVEFIALMAVTFSLIALSTDAMLPAFAQMTVDLRVANANDIQLVISMQFIGLAFGQLLYGSFADSAGRKPAIYVGLMIFIAGSVLSMVSSSFTTMLAGRVLQGLGAAGPRIAAVALVRDRYRGSEMARLMSFVMSVFILVPIFAPAMGQLILLTAGWRAIFGALILLAAINLLWFWFRQPETLAKNKRIPFTLGKLATAFREVLGHRLAMVATLITGCAFGAFLGYLNVCQQIFQGLYRLGPKFPLYFAVLAISFGFASLANSSLVMRLGMHRLTTLGLGALSALSWLFLAVVWINHGQPPLWLFMTLCLVLFFFIGIVFGNLNSIAMEPLGHVAGTAAAVIGSLSTLIAVALGYFIGRAYDGSLFPMATGFATLFTLSVLLIRVVWEDWREERVGH